MRLMIILILYLLTNVSCCAQMHTDFNDKVCYREALNYVENNLKTKDVFISPYFENIDWWGFPLDSLNDMPCKKQMIERNIEKTKFWVAEDINYEAKCSEELTMLGNSIKTPIYMLFFSKSKDGVFLVSAVPVPFFVKKIKKKKIYRHADVIRFNESIDYLFIFGHNNKIAKVLMILKHYD